MQDKNIKSERIKMAVLKNLRSLSSMEFYKNAIRLRVDITNWMLRNFGIKRNARSVNQVIKNIDVEDQKIIDSIFEKYGKTPNKHLCIENGWLFHPFFYENNIKKNT